MPAVLIFFLSFSFFLIQYDRMRVDEQGLTAWYEAKSTGILTEGDQYRVAIPFLAHFIKVHTRIEMRQSIPVIEFFAYGIALISLYLILVTSSSVKAASHLQRTAIIGYFFVAAQLPVLWIFPWERPETLPTAFYLATATLVILENRIPMTLACASIVLLSFAQSLARTDAPMVVGLATVVAATSGIQFQRIRTNVAILGLLCGGTGVVTHLLLHHRFPSTHTAQRATTFQLSNNLNVLHPTLHIPTFLTVMLPLFFCLMLAWHSRLRFDSSDKLAMFISLIYLPVYVTFGILAEVRIFVPYLFLMSPTLGKLLTQVAEREAI
jgi:hypothetical protein